MTELENLAEKLTHQFGIENHTENIGYARILTALTTAFALGLGRASARTEAQKIAWEQNRRRIGGKPGRKDKTKRTRRTRAELEASKLEKTT